MASSLGLATMIWLASVHLWFARSPRAIAEPMVAHQVALWSQESARPTESLRRSNPEWDLMARTFTVLAFANRALAEPERKATYLATIDRIVDRTIADDARAGPHVFLLPYGRRAPFRDAAGRSLFVDGEIALMLSARQLVEPAPEREVLTRTWVERVVRQLEGAPLLFGESYPDEVWVFCNTVALGAIRLHDASVGTPEAHADLMRRWVASAREHMIDRETGLLVSKTTLDGTVGDGPEGSTLWLATDMLLLVDEDFAHDQYARARHELAGELFGFAWAREWPASWPGREDIDSGPTVPIVGANAGSSGLALVAARAFHDEAFTSGLVASVELAGFPNHDRTTYAAGNPLADAVITYAFASGPLWARAGVGRRGAP